MSQSIRLSLALMAALTFSLNSTHGWDIALLRRQTRMNRSSNKRGIMRCRPVVQARCILTTTGCTDREVFGRDKFFSRVP